MSAEYSAFLQEQMVEFGPVHIKRMFSGVGIFRDGLMFALVAQDILYFKTDEPGCAAFEAEGLKPFTYQTKSGPRTIMGYWRAPERCLDDPSDMAEWCRKAFAVALGKAKAKTNRRSRRA
ncbi:TfoX/Sxy family protein [Aestuariivirga sp.]|uniref:TfoX/Sxy family protein n=1 Tax=Aestuariivirga sp. TaxID=2650926 RepID=UPI0039E314CB